MSDRNGDGLPIYAVIESTKLERNRLAAEFALSRLSKAPPLDVDSEAAGDESRARPRRRRRGPVLRSGLYSLVGNVWALVVVGPGSG